MFRFSLLRKVSPCFVRTRYCSTIHVDYSKTLLLPKTSFPMRANASQVEPNFRKRCTKDLYEWQCKRYEKEGEKYPLWVMHDGPPYANGSPHIGHSLNKILKDIINRYKLQRGHSISYIPGWDCHGLPIELKAIQENNLLHHRYENTQDAITLRKLAKKVAQKAIKVQQKHFVEWGVMGDWDRPYLTLLPQYESAQISVFYDLYKQGIIYQGVRPVHWSPSSNTALAEAELEYPESYESLSAFCGFPIHKGSYSEGLQAIVKKHSIDRPIRLLIWTTTPWTLPANRGVCLHESIEYGLVSLENKEEGQKEFPDYYIIAKSRLEYLSNMFQRNIHWIDSIDCESIIGATYDGVGEGGKVYQADFVSDESGTGLVHTAPGHGQDDFKVLTGKYGVEPFCPVDHLGKFTDEVSPDLEGLEVLGEGNLKVMEKVEENGMLVHKHRYAHKYPHDWRTKKPIIVRTTKQWFTDLRSLIPKAIESLKDVEMIPSHGKERFNNILQQRDDWCISRQRCWGVPIPVFFHKDTQEPLINQETIDHLRTLIEKKGVDCWWSMSVSELLPPSYEHLAHQYERSFDTVDVWFDSGVSWNSVIRQRNLPVADLYLEGTDQYRGWFQSSLLTSTGVTGKAPYKRIVTHGFVLDGEGRKMSKSIGNVIDPAVILRGGDESPTAYGSDVLRMWVGSVDYTKDATISYSHIQTLSEAKRKIRNTIRFMLSNINDLKDLVDYKNLYSIDKYMLAELHEFANQITEHYDQFNYQKSSNLIQHKCIMDWSSFYFEATKDRLYADHTDSPSRRAAQTVLAHSLSILTKAMAPILCHMTEEIFENVPSSIRPQLFSYESHEKIFSVFQTGWFQLPSEWKNQELISEWQSIKKLKSSANFQLETLRREKTIGHNMDAIVSLHVDPSSSLGKSILNIENLHLVFNVSSVDVIQDSSKETPKITARPSEKRKCKRCWLRIVDDDSKCICPRCNEVLSAN